MSTSNNQAVPKRRREDKMSTSDPMDMDIERGRERLKEMMVLSWSLMPKPEEPPDIENMSDAQFHEHLDETHALRNRLLQEHLDKIEKEQQKLRAELRAKEAPLIKMQRREAERRKRIKTEYFRKNPLNKKLFLLDIASYSSIYVCCFAYAKLDGSKYKMFIKSLTDDGSYKVHLGHNKHMSEIVGLASEEEFNSAGPRDCWQTKERLPGLHSIGNMLFNYDDTGVILTNKTKEEVLRKFKEYEECDFVKAGQIPMESVVFGKDDCVALPPSSEPSSLSIKLKKLKKLGMPVKLSEDGERVCVTDAFCVCQVRKRVTADAAEILKFLDKKMFKYFLLPLCCWSASSKKTESFDVDLPDCW